MKPSLAAANSLLDSYLTQPINKGWVTHGRSVGDSAGKIAAAINQHSRTQLDVEKVITLGYLHDIGKSDGNFNFLGHLLKGYVILKAQHYPADFCHICLTHSFISNNPHLTLTGNLFAPDQLPSPELLQSLRDDIPGGDGIAFLTDFLRHHAFTLEEKIISLCDLMCLYSPLTLEARIIDIISRHGTGDGTQAFILAALDLKKELETLAGNDLAIIIGAK